jgi:hypothetical protein
MAKIPTCKYVFIQTYFYASYLWIVSLEGGATDMDTSTDRNIVACHYVSLFEHAFQVLFVNLRDYIIENDNTMHRN